MKHGDIIRKGNTEEVLQDPQLLSVAEILGHKSFLPFERSDEKSIRLLPSMVELRRERRIPEGSSILSIPDRAIREGEGLKVKTISAMKEEEGNTLLLEEEGRNLWWFQKDRTIEKVDSVSISLDSCYFLQ